MNAVLLAIALHVGFGALWVASSLAIAATRRATRWALPAQMGMALIVVAAGIYLWGALHSGPQGPTEHWLTLGTVAAFVGLGLQLGVIAARRSGDLAAAPLWLYRASTLFLCLAAAAMLASHSL